MAFTHCGFPAYVLAVQCGRSIELWHARGERSGSTWEYLLTWELTRVADWIEKRGSPDMRYATPRVNNKEGKRVSNALYTPCNMFSASNVTCSRAHVTSPRG